MFSFQNKLFLFIHYILAIIYSLLVSLKFIGADSNQEKFLPNERWKDYISQPLPVTLNETTPLERTNAAESAYSYPISDEHFLTDEPAAVNREYLVPESASELGGHSYPERVETQSAKLHYFYIQAQAPEVPAGSIVHIQPTYQESLKQIQEVKYVRSNVIDESAREAQRMSAHSERLLSYEDSIYFKYALKNN